MTFRLNVSRRFIRDRTFVYARRVIFEFVVRAHKKIKPSKQVVEISLLLNGTGAHRAHNTA